MSSPWLTRLTIADPPPAWEGLGFTLAEDAMVIGGVRLQLCGEHGGITAWALDGLPGQPADIDGLPTACAPADAGPALQHPNGALAIDHVVVLTPDFDRTTAALSHAGVPLRRIRAAGGARQGFRRLGPSILELVELLDAPDGPARFWGLVVTVGDLDALGRRLGGRLGRPRPAVQPGRLIATLRAGAGPSPQVAFMTPEPGG